MPSTEIIVVQECSALKWCQRETAAYAVIQIKEGSHISEIIHTYIKEHQPRMPWGNLKDSNCNGNTTIFTEIKSADQNNYILIKKNFVTTLVFLVSDLSWAILLLFYIKRD